MRRLSTAPNAVEIKNNIQKTTDWTATVGERLNVYQGDADPDVSEIPENQWIVFHNTTAGEVRIWTNIAGVALRSAAFT